ncbi:hypothetical protein JOM56_005679 [Amanita muscaria]
MITVLTKLSSHKIKLEKHNLTKKRTCTLRLHGPWGENVHLQVFLRVTFTFPRDYPYAKHPNGVPTIDVERNPRNRAFMHHASSPTHHLQTYYNSNLLSRHFRSNVHTFSKPAKLNDSNPESCPATSS